MKTILISSRRTTFLDCASVKIHTWPPHTPRWEKHHKGKSSHCLYLQMVGKIQAYDIFDHLELEPHHLTPSFMSYTRSSFWCKLMTRHITQHRYTKQIDHGLVHKAILTSAYHTMRSHDPSWYITSLVCWSTCTYNLLLSLALIPTYGDQAKHMDTPTNIA